MTAVRARAAAVSRRRGQVLVALVALALVQVAHILDQLRWSSGSTFSSVLVGEPNGQLGIVLALVAFLAVVTRWEHAPRLASLAGGVVAVGFVLYHGIPFKPGVNNPNWGPNGHADAIRWLTVLTAIALGITVAWLATGLRRIEERS